MIEDSIEWLLIILYIICAIIFARFMLDKIARWLENKGWFYYKKKTPSGVVGNALLNTDAVFNPKANYVIGANKKIILNTVNKRNDKNPTAMVIETFDSVTNEREFLVTVPNSIKPFKN